MYQYDQYDTIDIGTNTTIVTNGTVPITTLLLFLPLVERSPRPRRAYAELTREFAYARSDPHGAPRIS